MSYSNVDYNYWNNYYLSSSSSSSSSDQMYYSNNNNGGAASISSENETSSNLSKIDIESAIRGEKKLDLKLTKTPSLLKLLSNVSQVDDGVAEKRKALNFPVLCLQIGSWMRESRHEGDLVAKCYFKKRQLVWETLNGNLKNKIEFQWSNVSAINASYNSNIGILDIMLDQPPLFFQEINPQPRKHTNWEQCEDFTINRQASLVRKHRLLVASGVLEKNYKQIIQGDPKLYNLSQQPFPYESSMYFPEIHFSTELHVNNNPSIALYPSAMGFSSYNNMSSSPTEFSGDHPNFQSRSNQMYGGHGAPHQVDCAYSGVVNGPMIDDVGLQQLSYTTQAPDDIITQMAALRTDLPYYGELSSHQSSFSYDDDDYLLANDHQLSHNFQNQQYHNAGGGNPWMW